jgi:hypothetical protein
MKTILPLALALVLFSCDKSETPCGGCGDVIEVATKQRLSDGWQEITYTVENECGTFDIVTDEPIVTDYAGYVTLGDSLCQS